jgi:hypothetical protein
MLDLMLFFLSFLRYLLLNSRMSSKRAQLFCATWQFGSCFDPAFYARSGSAFERSLWMSLPTFGWKLR